jgi:hypothetical protein
MSSQPMMACEMRLIRPPASWNTSPEEYWAGEVMPGEEAKTKIPVGKWSAEFTALSTFEPRPPVTHEQMAGGGMNKNSAWLALFCLN